MNKMGRPRKCRMIDSPPRFSGFKPGGSKSSETESIFLSIDEFEAIRLADYENMSHDEGSLSMGISRPVFTRLLESAHKKIADVITNGKELIIEGGNVQFRRKCHRCRIGTESCEDCDKQKL